MIIDQLARSLISSHISYKFYSFLNFFRFPPISPSEGFFFYLRSHSICPSLFLAPCVFPSFAYIAHFSSACLLCLTALHISLKHQTSKLQPPFKLCPTVNFSCCTYYFAVLIVNINDIVFFD